MDKVNLVFIDVPGKVSVATEIQKHYANSQEYELLSLDSHQEADQFISMEQNGIVVFKVETKPDLQKIVQVMKSQKKLIKKGLVRFACFQMAKSKKVEQILAKYGCQDLLDVNSTTLKSFNFKLNFWSKNIRAQEKKNASDAQRNQIKSLKKDEVSGDAKKEEFEMVQALALQSDIWILKAKWDYKKVLQSYLVKMAGPSPHVGRWQELETRPGDKQQSWKFVLKDDEGQFILEDGAWYFSGSKPEFDWKTQRWNFSAQRPHLYFYTGDEECFSRFRFKEGHVELCENSTYALTKEELILKTCDSKYSFANEGQADDPNHELEADNHASENLHGRSNSDNLGEDKIRGKLSHQKEEDASEEHESNFSEDPLGGPLKGKSSSDNLGEDKIRGKLSHEKEGPVAEEENRDFSEDPLGGPLKGKSSSDNLGEDKIRGKLGHEKEKPVGEEEKRDFSEDPLGAPLSGKSNSENLGEDKIRGKLGHEKEKHAGEEEERDFSEDPLGAPMSGKSNSENLGEGKIRGKLGHEKEKSAGEEEERDFSEDPLGAPLSGKSNSENLGEGKIRGKLGHEKEKHAGEEEERDFSEDPLGAPLKGKSKSDNLGEDKLKGHVEHKNKEKLDQTGDAQFSQKKDSEQEEDREFGKDPLGGPLKGKSSSDDLGEDKLKGLVDLNKQHKLASLDNSKKTQPSSSDQEGEREFGKDPLAGPLKGKSNSDDLGEDKLKEPVDSEQRHRDFNDKLVHYGSQKVNTESGSVSVTLSLQDSNQNVLYPCEMEDFYPEELTVAIDKKVFKVEDRVSAQLRLKYDGKTLVVEVLGVVSEVEDEGESCILTIEVEKVDEKDYENFIKLYQTRQDSIDQFMTLAKGF